MLLNEGPDEQIEYTQDLNELVASVEVKDKNSNTVTDEMEKGRTYYLKLAFTEESLKQLDHVTGELKYKYSAPANIGTLSMISASKVTIDVEDANQVKYPIDLTISFSEVDSTLIVQFDTTNPAYAILTDSGNVSFELELELQVADDYAGTEIDFGNGKKVQVVDQKSRINISGTKTWIDAENQDGKRPGSITVNLYADDVFAKAVEVTPDVNGNWSYEFTDLLEFQDDGTTKISYTIGENTVAGYTSTTTNGYNLVNTHTPETVDIRGNKSWNDGNNQDGKRPTSITVDLLANGEKIDSVEVTADGNWSYSFLNLPKYKNGQEIKYTLTDTVDGYTSTLSGYNLVNTHTPETVQISGSKTWNDDNNADGIRPESITVLLFENGSIIRSQTVTPDASGNWVYDFGTLPKYKDG